jgi:acetyltransferase-like isoleucine patch superfamily enzyme
MRAHPIVIGTNGRIRSGSAISDGVRIGDRFDAGHNVTVGEDAVFGDDCHLANNTIIGSGCTIGDRVTIDANCYVAQFTTIEDDVTIAAGVCLANDPHPGSDAHLCVRGPTIQRGAQIGMNATVLPFVIVGERSLVGAGSVVTRDVPAELVVAGNPARILKSVSQVTCPLDLEAGQYLRAPQGRPARSAAGGR